MNTRGADMRASVSLRDFKYLEKIEWGFPNIHKNAHSRLNERPKIPIIMCTPLANFRWSSARVSKRFRHSSQAIADVGTLLVWMSIWIDLFARRCMCASYCSKGGNRGNDHDVDLALREHGQVDWVGTRETKRIKRIKRNNETPP